jgi:beta-lactamase superfamily II metal-dependent hydrolase
MSKIFRLHLLPARQGDCLWIEYGEEQKPKRILIDGGTPATYAFIKERLQALPAAQRSFELLVVTHVDSDHIGGMLPLMSEDNQDVHFDDLWFNAWKHLPKTDLEAFGPAQGEKLASYLEKSGLAWNKAFKSKRVCLPRSGPPPVFTLPGDLKITLLSPSAAELVRLRPFWADECKKAGLIAGQPPTSSHPVPAGLESMGAVNINQLAQEAYERDDSPPNGSSIALLVEYDNRRLLLAGDAHAEVLLKSIKKIIPAGEQRLRLDAFKLPHHGSKYNLNRALLEKLNCSRYLFSTDGTQFKHPDRQAVARVIKYGGPQPQLLFNYRSKHNELWDNKQWMEQYEYSVAFPQNEQEGLVLSL